MPHPDDIVTSTFQIMSVARDVLLDKIVVYHILCLYVECNVLCGNKALLNLNLN